MKLTKVCFSNFRCYKDETEIDIGDLSCMIGKNDIGKSTILDVLDAFFNDNIDKNDLNTKSQNDQITISCHFSDLPKTIVLDTSVETSLSQEFMLNSKGLLEIKRVFKFGKTISKGVFLKANHPTHEKLNNLLSLKNTDLKSLATDVNADLTDIDKKKNPPLRHAIRLAISDDTLEEQEIKVDGNLDTSNNLRQIWSSLKKELPIYAVFKTDKCIDDKDKDVQDPMKQAIKECLAIQNIQELLTEIEEKVRDLSTAVAEKTIKKLEAIDKSIAEKLKTDFNKVPTWDKVFDLTLLNDENIPLNKRGSGIKRLVLLSFFQAQAEYRQSDIGAPAVIYGIEEPETSQHPCHQEMIIESLVRMSEAESIQVLFTSHSSNLVREIPIESLIYISKAEDNKRKIEYGFDKMAKSPVENVIKQVIESLGVLPNPSDRIKVLVYVEGYHDLNALTRYSDILSRENENVINLKNSDEVAFILAGGSSLKYWINEQLLSGLGKPEVHIYDSNVPSYVSLVQEMNNEGEKRQGFNTTKQELENYLTASAIKKAYANNGISITLPEINDTMDVPLIVAEALHTASESPKPWTELDDNEKGKKASSCKHVLNSFAVDEMSVSDIDQRGSKEEILSWFNAIKQKTEA
ncbi:MAG: ATP-binding protein [Victivallaceae bacterium]|nr:ATP-binding protein [Victivallaceae bacterium]